MFDAIIVGARCAGSPTAMLLAAQGHRVLLLDRARFPSDTLSTHYLPRSAAAYLDRWGLLGRVIASSCPPIHIYTSDWGDFTLVGRPPPVDGISGGFAPRRRVLDAILAEAAVAAGAELREATVVHELLWDDGRVVGVRGRTPGGHAFEERARIVVGADGRNSLVARQVGATMVRDVPALAFQYYSYFSGVSTGVLEAYRRGRRGFFLFPTNDGLACVIAAAPIAEFAAFRRDPAASYRERLRLVPAFAERVFAGRQEDRLFGTADLPNFLRRSHGPGWALVGDAGYHKDPQTGQGILDAFRDATALAQAIDAGLSGRQSLDEALADDQARRDAAVEEMFEHTCQVAAMAEPTPADFALRAALRDNPAETDRFFGIGDGTVSPRAFFAPANIRRIIERDRIDSAAS